MNNELSVYERLYEIAQKNIEVAGQKMVFTKDAFLYSTQCDLKNVNCFDMVQYDKKSLIQVLYVAFFYRTPEENARISWGKLENISDKEFQKRAFQTLSASQEYFRNGTVIYNNIFSDASNKMGSIPSQIVTVNPYVEKAFYYYQKMPVVIKKMIKLFLGRTV